MSIPDILKAGRERAAAQGSSWVGIESLSEHEVEQLLSATLEWLRTRPGNASSLGGGWTEVAASKAGVLPMWAEEEDLPESVRKTLRPLRKEIYDLLEERGLIVKPAGQGSSVHVSPATETTHEGHKVTRANLGAWMVKCNPKVWDLESFLRDGNDLIDDWSVQENYRSEMMEPGDLIFLWVTGSDRARLTPGVWGVGHVVAPSTWQVYQADEDDEGYWLDEEARLRARYFAQVQIPLLHVPLPRREVVADPRLANLEVLVSPQMGNPQFVSIEERDALIDVLGIEIPDAPEPDSEEISIDRHGAGFGDPLTNRVVELTAMEVVFEHFEEAGWNYEDVTADKCGWDITAHKAGRERHIEVKGVVGTEPVILPTRNEHATAQTDSAWCLMVVTQALSKQVLHEYDAATALAAAQPYVFQVDLT